MARKKFIRRLVPLPARPFFKSIENENRSARLLEVLRKNALQNQREEPQIFYSVRDVARHFSLPLSTVGRVYGRLKEEGILVGVPGSKTLLQGRRSGRHLSVLGVVGMPASVTSFVTVQDYRMFFIRTRRELRARGFAVATIFFNQGDIRTGRLISRIKKY